MHLAVILALLVNGFVLPALADVPTDPKGAFYLALIVHVAVTIYDGTFGRARTLTWLLLIVGWVGKEVVGGFIGSVLPSGQMGDWAVSAAANLFGDTFAAWLGSEDAKSVLQGLAATWRVLPVVALLLDLFVMQLSLWRHRPGMRVVAAGAGVVGGALVGGWLLGFAAGAIVGAQPLPDPNAQPLLFPIVPEWYLLPAYAILRELPNKVASVALMMAAFVAFLAAPWHRADRLRGAMATRWIWAVVCVALFGAWVRLGLLGAKPPDDVVQTEARALTAFHFAVLLVIPFALRRYGRPPQVASV